MYKMNRATAATVLAQAYAFDGPLAALGRIVDDLEDELTKQMLRQTVGEILGTIFRDLIYPIEQLYPELQKLDPGYGHDRRLN